MARTAGARPPHALLMLCAAVLAVVLHSTCCAADHVAELFVVDLDAPAAERWTVPVQKYKADIAVTLDYLKKTIDNPILV